MVTEIQLSNIHKAIDFTINDSFANNKNYYESFKKELYFKIENTHKENPKSDFVELFIANCSGIKYIFELISQDFKIRFVDLTIDGSLDDVKLDMLKYFDDKSVATTLFNGGGNLSSKLNIEKYLESKVQKWLKK